MAKQWDVEYDDFSGGYWVGKGAQWPHNTWRGLGLMAATDGTGLVPTSAWEANSNAFTSDVTGVTLIDGDNAVWGVGGAVDDWSVLTVSTAGAWTTAHTLTNAGVSLEPGGVIAPVAFNSFLMLPSNTANTLALFPYSGAPSSATTQATFYRMCAYNSFAFGNAQFSNRVYYCAALNPASWPAANYYDIGGSGATVTCMLEFGGNLWFGTTEGWYVASGVPGDSFTVRQANSSLGSAWAVSADSQLLASNPFKGTPGYRALCHSMSGSSRLPIHFGGGVQSSTEYYATGMARLGPWVLLLQASRTWVMDVATRVWHVVSNPTTFTDIAGGLGAIGSWIVAHDGTYIYRLPINPTLTGYTSPSYLSATATLAEYQRNDPFIVRELIAEVELDANSSTATRTLTTRVLLPGSTDLAIATATAAATATKSSTWAVAGTNQRATVRHNTDDSVASYVAQPEVTLAGVKLRRLIMRCQEV